MLKYLSKIEEWFGGKTVVSQKEESKDNFACQKPLKWAKL